MIEGYEIRSVRWPMMTWPTTEDELKSERTMVAASGLDEICCVKVAM